MPTTGDLADLFQAERDIHREATDLQERRRKQRKACRAVGVDAGTLRRLAKAMADPARHSDEQSRLDSYASLLGINIRIRS